MSRHAAIRALRFLFAAWVGLVATASAGPTSRPADVEARWRIALPEIPPVVSAPVAASQPADAGPLPAAARRFLQSGRDRFEERLWGEAINDLARAVQAAPGCLEARLLLARAALLQGNLPLARTHLNEALAQNPADVAVHQLLGDLAWQSRDPAATIAHLRRALLCPNAEPKRPETLLARLMLGLTLCDEGYLAAGAEQLEAFLAAAADERALASHVELSQMARLYREKAVLALGEACVRLGEPARAVEAYRCGVKLDPKSTAMAARLAAALADAGRSDDARDAAKRLLADDATAAEGVELYLSLAKDEAARRTALGTLCELAAASEQVKLIRAVATRLDGQPGFEKQSAELLRKIVKLAPASAEDRVRLAALHAEAQEWDAFIAELAGVMDAGKEAGDSVSGLLEKTASSQERIKALLEAVSRAEAKAAEPTAALLLFRGRLLRLKGEVDAAADAFGQAVSADVSLAPARTALAEILVAKGLWEDAVAACKRAVTAGVRDCGPLYQAYGEAFEGLDDNAGAEEAYKTAARLQPKAAKPLMSLARLYQRRRAQQEVVTTLTRIVERVDAANHEAREALVRELLTSGQVDAARAQVSSLRKRGAPSARIARAEAFLNYVSEGAQTFDVRRRRFRDDLAKIWKDHPTDSETALILASNYWATREYDTGMPYAEAVLKLDEKSIPGREVRDLLLTGQLRCADAVKVLQSLLAERPRNRAWLARLAERSFDAEDYALSAQTCRRLIELYGQSAGADEVETYTERLLEALCQLNDADAIIELTRDWVRRCATQFEPRGEYLAALGRVGRRDEALAIARALCDKHPNQLAARRFLAEQLVESGRTNEAERRALEWVAATPVDPFSLDLLVYVQQRLRHWDAVAEITRSTDFGATPMGERFMLFSWDALLRAGRADEALRILRSLPRQSEEESQQRDRDLLDALISARRWADAEQLAEQIVGPHRLLMKQGKEYDKRIVHDVNRRLSTIYQNTGRLQRCYDVLEQTLEMLPVESEAYIGIANDLGYVYADTGVKLDRALALTRQAVADEPRRPAYLDSLAWCYYKSGDVATAARWLRTAVRRFDGTPDVVICDHCGDALYRLGEKDAAAEQWRAALAAYEKRMGQPTVEEETVAKRCAVKLADLEAGRKVETASIGGTSSAPAKTAEE